MFAAKVDDKGRLKLPSELQKYLAGLPDKTIFVTSLDRQIGALYPISLWEENERFFENYTAEPARAQRILFNANDLGSEEVMDGQGRIPVSGKMRRVLNIENQTVHLQASKGFIRLYSEESYQAQVAEASKQAEDDVNILQQGGLKW